MRTLAIAALLAVVSVPAIAAQGEVCTSESKTLTQTEPAFPLTNDVIFKCPTIGDVTIPQAYSQGWRVVNVWAGASMDTSKGLLTQQMAYTAVLEKL